jgi:uncharacterized damage-inducible protein DinB
MGYPAGTLGTLMELYEGVVGQLAEYLGGLSAEERRAAAEFDGVRVTVEAILRHVVESGEVYARYAGEALRQEEYSIKLPGNVMVDPVRTVRAVVPAMAAALEGYWEMSDAEVEGVMVDTEWGARYSLDQLLEHAIVHILWHRRQLGRVVARAAAQAV